MLSTSPSAAQGATGGAALDRALEELVQLPDGPPAAIAVIGRGKARSVHRAGNANPTGDGRLPRPGDRMRIASTSKAMSGGTALSLVEDGILSLDDTVGELLPDQPVAWHAVTLAQLLNHTSGLPDFTAQPAFGPALFAAPDDPPAPRDLLAFAAGEPLNFPPGSDYRYSNSDNVAVGLMVQAATGLHYPTALGRRVRRPLHLGKTSLGPAPRLPKPYIHGYGRLDEDDPFGDVSNVFDFGGWAWASGGIVSTPGNLNKFIRGYVGGALFGPATRDAQAEFVSNANSEPRGPGQNSAGLALFRYETRCGTVFGHTGSILGYTQFMAATRSGRRSVTVTVSTQDKALVPQIRRAEAKAVCVALA